MASPTQSISELLEPAKLMRKVRRLASPYNPIRWPAAVWAVTLGITIVYAMQWAVYLSLGEVWHAVVFMELGKVQLLPWAPFVGTFSHSLSRISHLPTNLFAFLLVAVPLHRLIGGRRLLWLFFIGGAVAGITQVAFLRQNSSGAGGAVLALIGAWAILFPRTLAPEIRVWAQAIRTVLLGAIILQTLYLMPGQIAGTSRDGHVAHLAGLLFGIAWAIAHREVVPEKAGRGVPIAGPENPGVPTAPSPES